MSLHGLKATFILFLIVAFVSPTFTNATRYTVGDASGWTIGVDYTDWASGKRFRVGDTVVFNYPKGIHDVVKVDGTGYSRCNTSPNSGILTSGNDVVTLTTTGQKWFICGFSGHCDAGQKLAITVE